MSCSVFFPSCLLFLYIYFLFHFQPFFSLSVSTPLWMVLGPLCPVYMSVCLKKIIHIILLYFFFFSYLSILLFLKLFCYWLPSLLVAVCFSNDFHSTIWVFVILHSIFSLFLVLSLWFIENLMLSIVNSVSLFYY